MWYELAAPSAQRHTILGSKRDSSTLKVFSDRKLQRKDVVNALHAEAKSESWVECNSRVGRELRNRESASSITLLPKLLERVPVLLFAGDQDFICNYMGIESLIANMEWSGQKGLGVRLLTYYMCMSLIIFG
jgi:carboxypeptidase C (cathepsin A)